MAGMPRRIAGAALNPVKDAAGASCHSSGETMAKKFPDRPARPERTCWGCDRYCAADAMVCGNGSERTQHPAELFGDDWRDAPAPAEPAAASTRVIAIGVAA